MFRWPFAFLPMRCGIVEPSSFKATVGEWKTVIEAMKHYKKYLENLGIKDEDQQLAVDDDIHRLMMMIPDFERQFKNNYPGVI